jgi:hypothetical protein
VLRFDLYVFVGPITVYRPKYVIFSWIFRHSSLSAQLLFLKVFWQEHSIPDFIQNHLQIVGTVVY